MYSTLTPSSYLPNNRAQREREDARDQIQPNRRDVARAPPSEDLARQEARPRHQQPQRAEDLAVDVAAARASARARSSRASGERRRFLAAGRAVACPCAARAVRARASASSSERRSSTSPSAAERASRFDLDDDLDVVADEASATPYVMPNSLRFSVPRSDTPMTSARSPIGYGARLVQRGFERRAAARAEQRRARPSRRTCARPCAARSRP